MNNNFTPWPDIDFSWPNDAISRISEAIRSLADAMSEVQTKISPLLETIEQYKQQFNSFGTDLAKALRPLVAIEKMGNAQFVYWDYMTSGYVNTILDAKNINKTLRELMYKDKFNTVNNTIDKTIASPELCKHMRLYAQSVKAFRKGDSDLAVTGFTSVFDGLLSDISNNTSSNLTPRIKTIKEKLEKDELLDQDEYATLTLALTFEKTLDTFSAYSNFSQKEPKGLNRHWIAHGRSTRKKTKLDCVKMINLIYGLLLIEQLDSLGTSN